jgi:hypothetical protein
MSETFQIVVPTEFSEIAGGDAPVAPRRPLRRLGVGEVVTFSVDWLNTVGSFVSVVATVEGVRRFASAVLRRHRERGLKDDEVTVVASRAGRASKRLTLHVDDPTAEDQLIEFMLDTLRRHH